MRFVLGIGVIAIGLVSACATAPDSSSSTQPTSTYCQELLTCCTGVPTDQVAHCNAVASDPNSTDMDCHTEILQHYVDGYCDANGNVTDAGTQDASASKDSSGDAPPPESTCPTLPNTQCISCCVSNHPVCVHAVRVADAQCLCTPSECATACASTVCTNPDNVPTSGPCSDCIFNSLTGNCGGAADTVLQTNSDCTAEQKCGNGCPP